MREGKNRGALTKFAVALGAAGLLATGVSTLNKLSPEQSSQQNPVTMFYVACDPDQAFPHEDYFQVIERGQSVEITEFHEFENKNNDPYIEEINQVIREKKNSLSDQELTKVENWESGNIPRDEVTSMLTFTITDSNVDSKVNTAKAVRMTHPGILIDYANDGERHLLERVEAEANKPSMPIITKDKKTHEIKAASLVSHTLTNTASSEIDKGMLEVLRRNKRDLCYGPERTHT